MLSPLFIRLRRLTLPTAWLLLLLERSPVARVVVAAAASSGPSRSVAVVRSALAGAVAFGGVHALAGATQFVVTQSNVVATVGTPITPVAFTVIGATVPSGSFTISGALPPGLTVANANSNGLLNGSAGTISGTPTQSGNYTVSILAWERANGTGDSFGPTLVGFTITTTAASGPTIVTHPATQTASIGATVTLMVVATGSPAPSYQWRKNGTLVSGATGASLTLTNVQPADAGAYTAVVSNSIGLVTSNAATLTVVAGGPVIATQPQSQHVTAGAAVALTVGATGNALSYQWRKNGVALPGATNATLSLANAEVASMGFYAVVVSNATGSTTSAPAAVTVNTGGRSRLINVSTRGYVPAGGALTPGFVLQGAAAKTVVIRAIGPTLGAFGVSGTLVDPVMEVIPLGSAAAVASNDNWGGGATLQEAFRRVGAFPLTATNSNDASVETALNATGATGYTVRITSKNPAIAGIALAEVYDAEALTTGVRLVNVSTSGFVGTGDQALVPGFFIGGDAPKQLLIRAVGPGLTPFGVSGVLADPQLTLVPLGQEFTVAANDNWGGGAALQAAFAQAGAFALPDGSRDAAVVVRLPPGGYTVIVAGVGATTGTALVEIYDLDP
ncbi:immunoglobulin domain-containing protein [Horticoccus sp. 23ND18S-11]|uniref:immunoglobulin domain-containing protein n=1 Tax=Horticoccus sp. 23ND18S-11 TaxID=3391832 RepID=UPI0039C9688F